ncbi:MAG: serine O-acetyltransferase [Myxococcales bacterium]|nr:serine O-acetyltransferase [Myxococcales bacterium]
MSPKTPRVTPPSEDCDSESPHKGGRLACYLRDVDAVLEHDPAAQGRLEVVLTYPGVHALWLHRAAHRLWSKNFKLTARLVSHGGRFLTGIEIHPGARIGQGVFIDHGMGVVIGETATVGDGCILYKGVVLGGTSNQRGIRHPQLGKKVVLGTNACVLGNISVGDGARIGSGSVVIRDVPSEATVVGVPGRIAPGTKDRRARFDATLDHANLPDPLSELVRVLRDENERLRARVQRLEERLSVDSEDPTEAEEPHLLDGELATKDLPPQHGG